MSVTQVILSGTLLLYAMLLLSQCLTAFLACFSAPATQAMARASYQPPIAPSTRLLMIGDSFSDALGMGLTRQVRDLGGRVVLAGKTSTSIGVWAYGRDLKGLLTSTRPDLVIIVLGGNELLAHNPGSRAAGVRRLVERVGPIPCVWVAPPVWSAGQTGVIQVIEQNAGPCRFWDTNVGVPVLSRRRDGRHPDLPGQDAWAGAFLAWLGAARDRSSPTFAFR